MRLGWVDNTAARLPRSTRERRSDGRCCRPNKGLTPDQRGFLVVDIDTQLRLHISIQTSMYLKTLDEPTPWTCGLCCKHFTAGRSTTILGSKVCDECVQNASGHSPRNMAKKTKNILPRNGGVIKLLATERLSWTKLRAGGDRAERSSKPLTSRSRSPQGHPPGTADSQSPRRYQLVGPTSSADRPERQSDASNGPRSEVKELQANPVGQDTRSNADGNLNFRLSFLVYPPRERYAERCRNCNSSLAQYCCGTRSRRHLAPKKSPETCTPQNRYLDNSDCHTCLLPLAECCCGTK